ncbi:hypothetical protein [Alistipes putredinis]|uniref:hypothetical protein n=1 Tax=Alistipes putredinis TaxID=28117 RepID=UPI003AB18B5C
MKKQVNTPTNQVGATAPTADSAVPTSTPTAAPAPENPVAATSDGQSPAEPAEVNSPAAAPDPRAVLVVCAYPGTEALMEAVWNRLCDEPLLLMPVDKNTDIREVLETCIADERVDDTFILVPANTIPCSKIAVSEMTIPIVYIDKRRKEQYNHRLPMSFGKKQLVTHLAATDATGEEFIRGYVERFCTRPVQVSFAFGNYVTPVLRPNPCEHIVLEGLIRRKFIAASPEGFAAIEEIIRGNLLK